MRLRHAFTVTTYPTPNATWANPYDTIYGIGTDGLLYVFNGKNWEPLPMEVEHERE